MATQKEISRAGLVTEDRLKELLREVKYSEDFCRPYFERAKEFYKLTRQFITDEDWPYTNKAVTPDTLAFVEDAAADKFSTLYGTIPFVAWKPQRGFLSDGRRIADPMEEICAWQIESNIDQFTMEGYGHQKNETMYGTSHMGVFPLYDKFRGKNVVVGSKFMSADYWDLLPNPNDWMSGRWATWQYFREFLSKDAVRKLFEDGVFKGNFDRIPQVDDGDRDSERRWHPMLLEELGWQEWKPAPDNEELMEVLHRFENGGVITIVNRGYVCRRMDEPFEYLPYNVPFQDSKYTIFNKEYFGVGIPEIIESLQRDKWLVRSQHRDNIDLILNAILMVNRNSDLPFDRYEIFPTAVWPVDDTSGGDIQPVEFNDVTSQNVLAIEDKVEYDMDRGVGSSRYGRGEIPPHARETLGTVVRLQQAGQKRINTNVMIAEATGVRRIGWCLALNAQRELHPDIFQKVTGLSKEEVFGGAGSEPDEGWDLRFKVEAHPLGASITRIKELHAEQMIRIFELAMNIPPNALATGTENPRGFEVGELLDYVMRSQGLTAEEVKRIFPLMNEQNQAALTVAPGQQGGPEDEAAIQQALAELGMMQGGG